ncbi:uncharacterized protein [Diadema setosum]|uniref:uncharacterized protein n=1 Tax=Diadema setosum TaxID=31175 RepID=UPI003B3B351F
MACPGVTLDLSSEAKDGEKEFKGDEKLGKKMAYLLRYGAMKEGLSVREGGFVKLADLMEVPMLSRFSAEDVLKEVKGSLSYQGKRRFEYKREHNEVFVRAAYSRRLERNPYHEGTRVPRLLEQCQNQICLNIKDYCLEDCPDEFLIGELLHRLKRKGKLTNTALENLLGPNIQTLNLGGALVTQRAPKIIVRQCPNLEHLSLKDCGYLVTDHVLIYLMKRLPHLKSLNLCSCSHLTTASLHTIPRHLPHLEVLDVSWVSGLTERDIVAVLEGCPRLRKLLLLAVKLTLSEDTCVKMATLCTERGLKVTYCKQDVTTVDCS